MEQFTSLTLAAGGAHINGLEVVSQANFGLPAPTRPVTEFCDPFTVRRRWVSERLVMGYESRVTPAIGRVKQEGPPELNG